MPTVRPVSLTLLFVFGNLSLIKYTITKEYYYICLIDEEENNIRTTLLPYLLVRPQVSLSLFVSLIIHTFQLVF